MFYSKKKIIQTLGEILKHKGITHIVMSPGSRNAPMIIHFNQQKIFKTYSIVDERCAAFFALGISQSIKNPVVINCTSGSAVANYYPAITEAFYQYIPLIIITADRPKEYLDIFEGQTIRQENFFKNHTVKSVQLTEDISNKGLLYNERLINEAINESIIKKQPVHINIPISEPLYETTKKLKVSPKIINIPYIIPIINKQQINKFKKIWSYSKRKMILIGQCYLNKNTKKLLNEINKDKSIIILTETLSNFYNKNYIYIDRIIIPMKLEEWKIYNPDILLTIGKNIISKKLKLFLRKLSIKYHWHIESIKREIPDTYQKLTSYIITTPEYFLKNIIIKNNINSNYKKKWLNINLYREKKHNIFIKKIKFSDIKVLDFILKKIPKKYNLQLGNSTIIRYQQYLYKNPLIKSYSNRGTSGIDGSLSTALGFSVVSNFPVLLIIGDISFFYDSNALWNNYIPHSFRIILINNGGGNIFKMISKNHLNLSEIYFENKHNITAKYLCKTYNIDYYELNNMSDLISYINNFWQKSKNPKLIEINTKNCNNEDIIKQYFNFIN